MQLPSERASKKFKSTLGEVKMEKMCFVSSKSQKWKKCFCKTQLCFERERLMIYQLCDF